jgi:type IV pilus assembly protein PilM
MDWKKEIRLRDFVRVTGGIRKLWSMRPSVALRSKLRKPAVGGDAARATANSLRRLRPIRPSVARGSKIKRHRSARGIVGLKIGASQLAAAHVVNNGSVEVLKLARRPLDGGVVVGGELRDPQALVSALREFFKENRLPRREVRLGVSSNRIVVRTFDLTDVEGPRQIENAVRFRAQEVLPVPLDEAVLDYRVLREDVGEDGKRSCRVLLVAVHRDFVTRYAEACKRAGLKLIGIDLEAFALARAVAPPPEPGAEAAVAVASIGHDRTTFAVTDGNTCEFTRVFDWGGSSLNREIARALDLAPSEAEPIKRALGGSREDSSELHDVARTAALGELQRFARELVASLAYYQNQPAALPIREVVVTGGTSHLDGLAVELERLAGLPVGVGDPLERVHLAKAVAVPDQLGSFAVALGLGIEA